MLKQKIIDVNTGEEVLTDYTPQQIQEVESVNAERLRFVEEQNQKYEAKKNLLVRLGITEEEAKLLSS